jgi:DNA polymerase-3 subunit alpha (Gram-positive type)
MKSSYNYFIFDLETTGLKPGVEKWSDKEVSESELKVLKSKTAAVIEIAIIILNENLNKIAEYSSGVMRMYDDRGIEQAALDHNGITRQQIEQGRDSKEVYKELMKFIKDTKITKSKLILCGQNIIKFDNPHFEDFFRVHGGDLWKHVDNGFFLDTLLLGRCKHIESENYQLGTLCKNVGISLTDAHRAMRDTRANADLIINYIRALRGEGTGATKKEERLRIKFQF